MLRKNKSAESVYENNWEYVGKRNNDSEEYICRNGRFYGRKHQTSAFTL